MNFAFVDFGQKFLDEVNAHEFLFSLLRSLERMTFFSRKSFRVKFGINAIESLLLIRHNEVNAISSMVD